MTEESLVARYGSGTLDLLADNAAGPQAGLLRFFLQAFGEFRRKGDSNHMAHTLIT